MKRAVSGDDFDPRKIVHAPRAHWCRWLEAGEPGKLTGTCCWSKFGIRSDLLTEHGAPVALV